MVETSEPIYFAVNYLDAIFVSLTIGCLIFAPRLCKFFNRMHDGASLRLAELLLFIEIREESFGGYSYYSRLLRQYVKKKKVYELAEKLEERMPMALRIFVIGLWVLALRA